MLKEAIGLYKKSSFKFPNYFLEEVVTKTQGPPPGRGAGDGCNAESAPAHPVPPPPPEPPPLVKISDKH